MEDDDKGIDENLKFDGIPFPKSFLDLPNDIFGMSIKDIKIPDTVFGKKGSCHCTVEFPHFV